MDKKQLESSLKKAMTAKGLPNPKYAVVVPFVYDAEEPCLLIEVRAQNIFQAGDPCFPGGKIEPGETPAQAAAREMEEELGIKTDYRDFLGQLPTVQTKLGSYSDVFVCLVPEKDTEQVRINQAEVSELLRVPISLFLSRPNDASYPVDGHVIWGMTAGAIRHFCRAWQTAFGET